MVDAFAVPGGVADVASDADGVDRAGVIVDMGLTPIALASRHVNGEPLKETRFLPPA